MVKQTDFAVLLNRFLTDYLPNKRGDSPQTIDSYRYSFIFLIDYYEETYRIGPDRLSLADITYGKISGYFASGNKTFIRFHSKPTTGSN